ncbi:hypothetical protein RHSIM_RhsimUnG0015000 [Rhododendron simsii]|uniref:Uncharacterized protein n=1 Tax=Rhododendron simsii TaxID=118357 RepID=A0A834FXY0_RHOSS|nr:hypothetical protein RHSIM_RhsimUnG0015000 [Rhododendron simsii]
MKLVLDEDDYAVQELDKAISILFAGCEESLRPELEGKADSLTDHGQNIGRNHHGAKQESCETIGVYAMEKEESCSQSRKRRSKK